MGKVVFLFFLSTFGFSMRAKADAAYCSLKTPSLQDQAHLIYKKAAEESAQQPADFCKRNALLEYLENRHPQTDFQSLSTVDLVAKAQATATEDDQRALKYQNDIRDGKDISPSEDKWFEDYYTDPWQNSLIPLATQRSAALEITFGQWNSDWGHIEKEMQKPEPMSSETKQKISNNIDRLEANRAHDPQENSASLRFAACASLGLANASGCSRALKDIIASVVPTGVENGNGTKFSDLEDWKEIMTNDKYDEGLRQMSLLMIKRSKSPPENSANVMDDLTASFEKSNMSPKDAQQAAMTTMAVIANGGANTIPRVQELEQKDINDSKEDLPDKISQKSKSLAFIAAMMPWLDGYKSQEGGPLYSLPKNVKSTCDDAKSYHFWMIARLAQKMVQDEHVNPDAAAQAAYTIENAYQLKRQDGRPKSDPDGNSADNDVDDPLVRHVYDSSLQMDRSDLSFAVAGAFYGANFDKQASLKLDADSSLPVLIDHSTVLEPLLKQDSQTMGSMSKYLRWENIFAPKAAFDNIKQQADQNY